MSDVRMRMKKDPVAWPILGEYNRGFVHYPDSFAIPASPLWIISGLLVTGDQSTKSPATALRTSSFASFQGGTARIAFASMAM